MEQPFFLVKQFNHTHIRGEYDLSMPSRKSRDFSNGMDMLTMI